MTRAPARPEPPDDDLVGRTTRGDREALDVLFGPPPGGGLPGGLPPAGERAGRPGRGAGRVRERPAAPAQVRRAEFVQDVAVADREQRRARPGAVAEAAGGPLPEPAGRPAAGARPPLPRPRPRRTEPRPICGGCWPTPSTPCPPAQRQTFVLHVDGGLSYQEVADALGIAVGTVMSRLFYARQRLKAGARPPRDPMTPDREQWPDPPEPSPERWAEVRARIAARLPAAGGCGSKWWAARRGRGAGGRRGGVAGVAEGVPPVAPVKGELAAAGRGGARPARRSTTCSRSPPPTT